MNGYSYPATSSAAVAGARRLVSMSNIKSISDELARMSISVEDDALAERLKHLSNALLMTTDPAAVSYDQNKNLLESLDKVTRFLVSLIDDLEEGRDPADTICRASTYIFNETSLGVFDD